MPDLLGYFLRASVVLLAGVALYLAFVSSVCVTTLTEEQIKRTALVGAILFWLSGIVWMLSGVVWVVVG